MTFSPGRTLKSVLVLPAARLLATAVALAIVVGGVALLLPATYESQASVVFSVSTQQVSSQLVSGQLLSSLPGPASLAQAFTQRLETRAFSPLLEEDVPDRTYSARFEEKRGLLVLKASAPTRGEAQKRAEKLVSVAQDFLKERLVAAARANVTSALEQARVDLKTGEKILGEIRELLRTTPKRGESPNPAVVAGLEAMKVDPSIARSSNPAVTFLSLQEAQLAAQVASSRARLEALESDLQDPEGLSRLVGQALQVQVLSPPAEPVRRASPRPTLWAAAAFVATLAAGAVIRYVRVETP